MSKHNIRSYWPFCRVKIKDFQVSADGKITQLTLEPDHRYLPICSDCKKPVAEVHSYHIRAIRDLPMGESIVIILLHYRKLRCRRCGIRVEHHDFVTPSFRYTNRFVYYVFGLCEKMTLTDVANHLHLSWHQVKQIDKSELKKRYPKPNLDQLSILCIDEFSIKKHHQYMTVLIDYLTGRVITLIPNRDYQSVSTFFKTIPKKIRDRIRAVAMDMWDPYIKAVKEHFPNACIVFDKFHVVSAFGKVIDKIRNQQFKQASADMKTLLKGSRFLLLKNPHNLSSKEQPKLTHILKHNKTLAIAYILKDYLKRLWQYRYRKWAVKFLEYWCQSARDSNCKELIHFTKTLRKYSYGILNHCNYAIHTSKLEGIINKIKVIKRKAFGFLDMNYFTLKIIHATATKT
jgi:transposase